MSGPPAPPAADQFAELAGQLRGTVLRPGHPEYDGARKIFNGMIDRRPLAIVRCRDTADVAYAVRFARAQGLPIAARGGGHSIAGSSILDGGIVADLSPMRAVSVDPVARTASVQGGAVWGDVDHATQLHGLAVPGGFVSTTGVGGFTLGGGIAWTSRKLGLACDSLLSAELVNAKGEVVRVGPHRIPELFWALRGAGSSFGIVTDFRFRLQPVGPVVYGGFRVFPGERARSVLTLVRDLYPRTPAELNLLAILTTGPPAPFLPPAFHGKPIAVIALCYIGPPGKGPGVTREVRELPGAIVDQVGPMPYRALQSAFDPLNPPGLRNYWKSTFLEAVPEGAVDAVLDRFGRVPSPMTEIHFQYGGGAIARVPALRSPVGNRKSPYLFNLIAKWTDPTTDAANIGFVRDLWDALRPFATGGIYANFNTDLDDRASEASFGQANLRRLARLKKRYDPRGLFPGNQRIAPAR